MSQDVAIDRTSIRQPPSGWPIIYQTWDKLLFLHWPVELQSLRRLIPEGLEIDTWQGTAWVGVTPFVITSTRLPLSPAVPFLSASHELNVRTYVHRDGVPGVWFLSLDASNSLAVWGARIGFSLPYVQATMELRCDDERVDFHSVRAQRGPVPAEFHATWRLGEQLPEPALDSLEFFLIERYCLYSSDGDRLYRARIFHRPWPLRTAQLERLSSSMVASHGLRIMDAKPIVHAQAAALKVQIWPPESIGRPDDPPPSAPESPQL